MPTDPLQSILYRDLAKVAAREVIERSSPLLTELVNYGTNALVRCTSSVHDEPNKDLAVLFLYRHMIEMTDGVETLISAACPRPAIPLLRSSFEAWLGILYILEEDYDRRSLAWLAHYARVRIASHELYDVTSEKGKAFAQAVRADPYTRGMLMRQETSARAREVIERMRGLLALPQMSEVEAEYTRLRGPKNRHPEWYELWGGPHNLRDLAEHLKKLGMYDLLYRRWSRVSHAHDFEVFLKGTNEGAVMRPLRDPGAVAEDVREVAQFASSFMLDATRRLLKRFRPREDLGPWYVREVRPRYLQLLKKEPYS